VAASTVTQGTVSAAWLLRQTWIAVVWAVCSTSMTGRVRDATAVATARRYRPPSVGSSASSTQVACRISAGFVTTSLCRTRAAFTPAWAGETWVDADEPQPATSPAIRQRNAGILVRIGPDSNVRARPAREAGRRILLAVISSLSVQRGLG
jgi:hypothetical protein